MKKIVLVTGGFDPLHAGHIAYFEAAKRLGDTLIVGVNSDAWLTRKKGRPFMAHRDRCAVIQALAVVDQVIEFDDSDGSACRAIHEVRLRNPHDHIIFANGGDRTQENIPEMDMRDLNMSFEFGVGGTNKINSSSWILDEWKAPKTQRDWGYYRTLHEVGKNVKVKELTVMPGQSLSMQRHGYRSEFWFVATGTATVYTLNASTDFELQGVFGPHEHVWVDNRQWHQLRNEHEDLLRVVEIQYGENCVEEDIERRQ